MKWFPRVLPLLAFIAGVVAVMQQSESVACPIEFKDIAKICDDSPGASVNKFYGQKWHAGVDATYSWKMPASYSKMGIIVTRIFIEMEELGGDNETNNYPIGIFYPYPDPEVPDACNGTIWHQYIWDGNHGGGTPIGFDEGWWRYRYRIESYYGSEVCPPGNSITTWTDWEDIEFIYP